LKTLYPALNAYHIRNSAVIISRLATGLGALILAATTTVEGVVGLAYASSHSCVAGIDATGRVLNCMICPLLFVATDALWIAAKAVAIAKHRSNLEVATIACKISSRI
jgi:hypothetical protein